MRPLGKITDDMEKLMLEMIDEHDMQAYEIMGIIWSWMVAHRPVALDYYTDGKHCIMYLGHPDEVKIIVE